LLEQSFFIFKGESQRSCESERTLKSKHRHDDRSSASPASSPAPGFMNFISSALNRCNLPASDARTSSHLLENFLNNSQPSPKVLTPPSKCNSSTSTCRWGRHFTNSVFSMLSFL